jgi:hypothetical protein
VIGLPLRLRLIRSFRSPVSLALNDGRALILYEITKYGLPGSVSEEY